MASVGYTARNEAPSSGFTAGGTMSVPRASPSDNDGAGHALGVEPSGESPFRLLGQDVPSGSGQTRGGLLAEGAIEALQQVVDRLGGGIPVGAIRRRIVDASTGVLEPSLQEIRVFGHAGPRGMAQSINWDDTSSSRKQTARKSPTKGRTP